MPFLPDVNVPRGPLQRAMMADPVHHFFLPTSLRFLGKKGDGHASAVARKKAPAGPEKGVWSLRVCELKVKFHRLVWRQEKAAESFWVERGRVTSTHMGHGLLHVGHGLAAASKLHKKLHLDIWHTPASLRLSSSTMSGQQL